MPRPDALLPKAVRRPFRGGRLAIAVAGVMAAVLFALGPVMAGACAAPTERHRMADVHHASHDLPAPVHEHGTPDDAPDTCTATMSCGALALADVAPRMTGAEARPLGASAPVTILTSISRAPEPPPPRA